MRRDELRVLMIPVLGTLGLVAGVYVTHNAGMALVGFALGAGIGLIFARRR